MPENCKSLRLRLAIEHARLLDWGELAGLTGEHDRRDFDRKLKANRTIIMALLSEMRSLLKILSVKSLRYAELRRDEPNLGAQDVAQTGDVEENHRRADNVPYRSRVVFAGGSEAQQQQGPLHAPPQGKLINKELVEDIDLDEYASIFQSPDIPEGKRRHMKGLNHIIKLGKGVKDISNHPKRLLWATIDKESFQGTITRLKELTDHLHETLGDTQMQILLDTTRETYMAMLQLTSSVAEMKDLLSVAQTAKIPDTEADDSESFVSRGSTLVNQGVGHNGDAFGFSPYAGSGYGTMFEKLARFSVDHAELLSPHSKECFGGTRLGPTVSSNLALQEDKDRGTRTIARFRGENVWIEWKGYREVNIGEGPDAVWSASPRLVTNVERLVALLQAQDKPAEFCVPTCLGYYLDEDNDRFAFVYKLPDGLPPTAKPHSLLELLQGKVLPIRTRVKVARDLATCLFHFHAVNWLHKGLRSASVLFFKAEDDVGLRGPYISGFEYARPDSKDSTTTGAPNDPEWAVYCHPSYQKSDHRGGFRKTYDMYSIGIILLEIAYWKPADHLFELENSKTTTTNLTPASAEGAVSTSSAKLQDVRSRLLTGESDLLENVRVTMGERYHNAVKACIQGLEYFKLPKSAIETDPVVSAYLQQAYLRLVVDTLDTITL
ncbi:hypothetical protein B0A49_06848 [Cryomyces minteri]|uniref:Protein kinase domain-containing protein n=1 Tax=Cryomyces minteri TaxID=331657 RepID=A0A4U0X5T0_9PEZI|nr:hypothetical protein B0A49_09807 [Cryomyces minteri]TKA71822.1 hypothetical protein B0A49_06848 [Cryomyces minteri]